MSAPVTSLTACLSRLIEGFCTASTVKVASLESTTLPPKEAWPVATLVTEPASMSACVVL